MWQSRRQAKEQDNISHQYLNQKQYEQKSNLTKPPIRPLGGRWARVCLTALLTAVVTVGAQARATVEGGTRACADSLGGAQARSACDIVLTPPRDLNSELRHRTWSVYTQGGLSWATGVWYRNLDAKRSYRQSAAAGGGFDLTIRPWVRVGAEYIWSRYRREQHPSALDAGSMPVKAYGNYMMNLHNAKLGVGLNLMEMWPERQAQWLNIWAGTGAGYTFGRGNEYGIHFSSTQTQGGRTTPLTGGASIGNDDAVTITGNVRTTNRHERFNTFYIPASLHVAADDAATANLGSPWRMPTDVEIKELRDNCTWTRTTQDGVNGYQVDGPNGNAIFLPAAGYYKGTMRYERGSGYYWSSSLHTDLSFFASSEYACGLYFESGGHVGYCSFRNLGYSIRPVRP